MTLVRWDPFREMQTRLNRLLEEPYASQQYDNAFQTLWSPAVDIYEKDGNIVLTAELPGVDPKDINLSVEQNVLTLSGERKTLKDVEEKNFHRRESFYGKFTRSFALPRLVDRDKIGADYKDGVLTVTIPPAPEARPKQITIHSAA